jgi:hypothetical protein
MQIRAALAAGDVLWYQGRLRHILEGPFIREPMNAWMVSGHGATTTVEAEDSSAMTVEAEDSSAKKLKTAVRWGVAWILVACRLVAQQCDGVSGISVPCL